MNIKDKLKSAADLLEGAGVENPALDARVLLSAALRRGREYSFSYPEHRLSGDEEEEFAAMIKRRLGREPVSRIIGKREFWGLEFSLSPAVLDPRPDSETVIEAVIRLTPDTSKPLKILDLGTGSGCLLAALLKEYPNSSGVGIDASETALAIARENAYTLGVGGRAEFIQGNWCSPLGSGRDFDLVVSNPPYIKRGDIPGLEPEIRFDPEQALDGGIDGLDRYREIGGQVGKFMAGGALLVVEIGAAQKTEVKRIFEFNGLSPVKAFNDIAGTPRALAFRQISSTPTKVD